MKVWALLLAMLRVATLCEAGYKIPPIITNQPSANGEVLFKVASRQDENSIPFSIQCEAEGEPAPTFRWKKNGHEFDWHLYENQITQQPGKGTLVFNVPNHNDEGHYQCFATNEMGTATSNNVFVREVAWDNFTEVEPIIMQVTEEEPAALKCQAPNGYPKPVWDWLIQRDDGTLGGIISPAITTDPEGTLWFNNVTRADASHNFSYVCLANSTFLMEHKIGSRVYLRLDSNDSTAVQTQREPTQQYVSRKNTVILKGETLRLWCIFTGTPLPEISWKKSNNSVPVDLPLERVIYENFGKTLVIENVDFEDEGQYECEASNGVGVAKSYSINVFIQAVPYFEREPEIQIKAEGETAEFYCEADGRPSPKYLWFYNSMPISEAPANSRRSVEPNKITIHDLIKDDIGNYGCKAINEHGLIYKDVYINVVALPPEILIPPNNISSVDGKVVNMTCRVFGAPKPHITWFKDGQRLNGNRFQFTDVGDLIIKKVTFSDVGNYTCSAENKFGHQTAEGSIISVKMPTRITYQPRNSEVRVGHSANFRCRAVIDEDLELSIEWLRDGTLIDFEQEPRFVQRSDFSMRILSTTNSDSGTYTCVASTELDKVTSSAALIVQDVPNSPVVLSVVCNDTNASVEWQSMGDNRAPILRYIIQYNTSFTPDTWENAATNVLAGFSKFTIKVSPWVNYTFRVIARNKRGKSLPSDHSEMCTTPPNIPYKNPDGVEDKGSTPENLVIRWKPMPEIEHNAPGFKYRLYYKREDVEDAQWETKEIFDWKQDYFVVLNLPTFKPYRIKVEAHNEMGQAHVAAQEILGWTGEDVPTEAPTGLLLEEIINGSIARLSWNPVSYTSVRGHTKGYKIQTWTENETEDKAREIVVENMTQPRALITSFVPFTKNFVRVLVFNGAHDGPPSETINFVTPEGKPGPVEEIAAIQMGSSSAFYLTWKKPKNPNGIVTGYHIYYQEVWGFHLGTRYERDPPIRGSMITRAKLTGLQPSTMYWIIVCASTAAGQGAPNNVVGIIEPREAILPGKPSFMWQHISTPTGVPAIKITWIPNTLTNLGAHFYVKYKLDGDSIFQETKPVLYDDFTVLKQLKGDHLYLVSVVAVDGEFSTESDVEEIYT